MDAAAHDGRAYAIGQQESSGDGAIAQTHRAVHHLCDKTRQHHDQEAVDSVFGNGPDISRDIPQGQQGQQAMSYDHEQKGEKTPFDDLHPLAGRGSVQDLRFVGHCLFGHQHLGQIVQLPYFFAKITIHPLAYGLHIVQDVFHLVGYHAGNLFL